MTKKEIRQLRKLRDMLTMGEGHMCCGDHDELMIKTGVFTEFDVRGDDIGGIVSMNGRDYIVKTTRLWRKSWILPVIDELLEKYGEKYGDKYSEKVRP